jgi:7,8-didemethyl-8-hydroxy-5-deazariboflavin synthase CofH subunit
MTLTSLFGSIDRDVAHLLEASLEGRELSIEGATRLSAVTGRELLALGLVADALREAQVGERVTYVVNRNVNFTNVCVKTCRFCAFARGVRSEQGYLLPEEEVVRRVLEAERYGATEVCIQAGLAPTAKKDDYVSLVRAIRAAAPSLHIHAFSPEEIRYAADLGRVSVRELLLELLDAGLNTLPGTSAEILDDRVRRSIAPTRLSTAEWIEVIETAHELGIRTSSTMMFGHVETAEDRARHLDTLRAIQKHTGGFTEFVPLSFVHAESPLFLRGDVPGVTPGPSGHDVLRVYAIARLMLGAHIPNLQASWVKEGLRMGEQLLSFGVNDLGGTLMNESISTSAGAAHGQLTSPAALRHAVRAAGRVPAQRSTGYDVLRVFSRDGSDDPVEALDEITDPDAVFGSYAELVADERFRYEPRSAQRRRLVVANERS